MAWCGTAVSPLLLHRRCCGLALGHRYMYIFINDLPQCLTKGEDTPRIGEKYVNCLMYADDLVVMSLSIEDLQNQIDNLNKYCTEWGLEINKRKTKVMIMAKYGNKKPDKNVMVGNVMLEWAPSYKYLGIELHSNGNTTNCSKNLCKLWLRRLIRWIVSCELYITQHL